MREHAAKSQAATRKRYVLSLTECASVDVSQIGSKAAKLAKLLPAGFPVPEGFVVTSEAFDEFVASNAFPPNISQEATARASLPPDVVEAILDAFTKLRSVRVAVRSSGIAEDLQGASFAGQYDTVLGVREPDEILDAVRRCWSSIFSSRVAAYRAAQGQVKRGKMAVLVQVLVKADASGVAFTANPITGDRSETMVNAVRGLGDRLVSGQSSPDEWVIKNDDAIRRRNPEGALTHAQAKAVAKLAKRVATYFGGPQDIEWAIANEQLFLLQARPITALPQETEHQIPVSVEPPDGFWEREGNHYPEPLSPLHRSIFLPIFNTAMKHAITEASLLIETVEHREIGGWVYQRTVPLGGKDRRPPPSWLMPLLIRVVPQLRSRIKGSAETLHSDKPGSSIERWYTQWKPSLVERIAGFRSVPLTTLSDDALDQHIQSLMAFVGESIEIHALLNSAVILSLAEITFVCRDFLGWDDRQTLELFNGLSEKSSEPSRRLAKLGVLARESSQILGLLELVNDETVDRLRDADREFTDAFDAYQREFGCRALRLEMAFPTVAENPALVLSLVRDQVIRNYDPVADVSALEQRRKAAISEARGLLATCPASERERFKKALERGERAYPIREDNQFYTVSSSIALFRYAAIELGRRLAKNGQIARSDDVFFLELEEARAALRDGTGQSALVARRKAERAWVEAHPGPASYGKNPAALPSLAALPAEARFLTEAFLWAFDRVQGHKLHGKEDMASTILHGIAASPGTYTGVVRLIMNESEFSKLHRGDVLVCPITSPVWSVLFPSVGALVTDSGGILSHPAIIAREYRVPAVVATGVGTRVLHDGQKVTVDGSAGFVEIQS